MVSWGYAVALFFIGSLTGGVLTANKVHRHLTYEERQTLRRRMGLGIKFGIAPPEPPVKDL